MKKPSAPYTVACLATIKTIIKAIMRQNLVILRLAREAASRRTPPAFFLTTLREAS